MVSWKIYSRRYRGHGGCEHGVVGLVAKYIKIVREHAVSSEVIETAGTKYVISSGLAIRQERSDERCCSCLIQETDHRPHDLLDSLCPDHCAISYPPNPILCSSHPPPLPPVTTTRIHPLAENSYISCSV